VSTLISQPPGYAGWSEAAIPIFQKTNLGGSHFFTPAATFLVKKTRIGKMVTVRGLKGNVINLRIGVISVGAAFQPRLNDYDLFKKYK